MSSFNDLQKKTEYGCVNEVTVLRIYVSIDKLVSRVLLHVFGGISDLLRHPA